LAKIIVLSSKGDDVLEFKPDNAAAVNEAQALFDRLRSQKYAAFKVDGATQGEQIRSFDPNAETILMTPPIVAG